MSTKITKLMLFLSSYFPLFVILWITQRSVWAYWSLVPLIVGISSIIWLSGWLKWTKTRSVEAILVKKSKSKDPEVVAYIISYVLPLAGAKYNAFDGMIVASIFFFVVMVLNLNSNIVYINPVLNFIGYHMFEVELESGNDIIIITKAEKVFPNQQIKAMRVSTSIYIGEDQ